MTRKKEADAEKVERVHKSVREAYSRIASGKRSCCGTGAKSCCGAPAPSKVAKGVGYKESDLAALPDGANMGLSCGNPSAFASLRPGETVLDLGSGGGFDVFIVAQKVGEKGRAIGVDMTPDMISKARLNAVKFQKQAGFSNVEFRLGEIEHLPVADASVDVVISNCVINLSPDKPQVWREVARVLKPGGRVAVSDLALRRPLPSAVQESVAALVGCVAGAVLIEETERMLRDAGLTDIKLNARDSYIDSMAGWEDPLYKDIRDAFPKDAKLSDFVTSLEISARKPAR